MVSWEVEKAVWWRALKNVLHVAPQDCGLLMTEPLFNLPLLQTSTMQVPVPLAWLYASGAPPLLSVVGSLHIQSFGMLLGPT